MLKLSSTEYALMKKYIEDHCGIHLEKDKEYLIESRLSDLVRENGCRSFHDFHFKAKADHTGKLQERIVDAMTTNETSWFRDKPIWEYIEAKIVPSLIDLAMSKGKVKIWSAAVSTGQEIYSLLMLIDTALKNKGLHSMLDRFDFLGTDISSSALFNAISGRYDVLSINRGLPEDKKQKYFRDIGNIWEFDPELKKRVTFEKFNLQKSFAALGPFDFVMCRYVSIYFSERFKKELFSKMAKVIKPGGILLLGATETLREFSSAFDVKYNKNVVINTKR